MLSKNIVNNHRQTLNSYYTFATYFISPVVGKKKFGKYCWQSNFSSYVSKSDEAFAILTFENNYDQWMSMASNNKWTSSSVKPEYTTGGNSLQTPRPSRSNTSTTNAMADFVESNAFENHLSATSARCRGWSAQGIRRFNELFDLIEKERLSSYGSQFEEGYLNFCIEERNQENKKHTKRNVVYENCWHELWSNTTMPVETKDVNSSSSLGETDNFGKGITDCNNDQDDDESVGFGNFSFQQV